MRRDRNNPPEHRPAPWFRATSAAGVVIMSDDPYTRIALLDPDSATACADAQLIQQAPKMLKCLRWLLTFSGKLEHIDPGGAGAAIVAAKAVCALATDPASIGDTERTWNRQAEAARIKQAETAGELRDPRTEADFTSLNSLRHGATYILESITSTLDGLAENDDYGLAADWLDRIGEDCKTLAAQLSEAAAQLRSADNVQAPADAPEQPHAGGNC